MAGYLVDSAISEQRINICESCEEFRVTLNQCKVCGCFMPVKVRLKPMKCPLDKW